MIEYNLVRSRRKTIAIYITKEACVEVRAPNRVAKREIDHFVQSRKEWITLHLSEQQKRLEEKASFSLDYGDFLLLRGREYPIASSDGDRIGFDGQSFILPPNLPPENIKNAVIQIYKGLSKELLPQRAAVYGEQMGLIPAAVKVNSAKNRWGSCSGKGSLNFSWRLVMAADHVIDYVVVHELAHLRELNHSQRFWAVVESALPDYRERKEKLRQLQARLACENWDEALERG